MNVTAQKFQSLYALVRKPSARSNHRTTLPQSRPLGVPAPSEREPGMGCAIHRAARKPQRCGRFSSPLRNSKVFTFHHSSDDTPSVSLRSTAPSEREPGSVSIHRTAQKPQRYGRFSSPLRRLKSFLHSTIQRTTLPQSRPVGVTAPSEREPGTVRSPPGSLSEGAVERMRD